MERSGPELLGQLRPNISARARRCWAPLLTQTCTVQLQSFPVIEELTKRPLTRGSLPHCARGPRAAAAPFGRGGVRGKWINLGGLVVPDPTGGSRRAAGPEALNPSDRLRARQLPRHSELAGVAVCFKLIRCGRARPFGRHPSKKKKKKSASLLLFKQIFL